MANKGDIQHSLKVGSDNELYFSRINTTKASDNYGKLKSKSGIYDYPYLTRMTGDSIKGATDTIESNELRKGKTPSKKRIGNEYTEGSLDIELSPVTFDDNLAAVFKNEWKLWTSDNTSAINKGFGSVEDGKFITRCTDLTKDAYGNYGAEYNKSETFGTRLLLNDGKTGHEAGLIDVPEGCVVHELTCGSADIKYDVLRHLGGADDEDWYQDYEHLAIGSMSLDIQIGAIVTGSFSFMGANNPKRLNEDEAIKNYGASRFEKVGMTGEKFIRGLPETSTTTEQFTSLEGNLYVNGKNITIGESLSFEINNNLSRVNAIFVRKSIATSSEKLDVTGSLSAYQVYGESEGLYNSAIDNDTDEVIFVLQDKEEDPNFLYVFQIFKCTMDPPDTSNGSTTSTDSYNITSHEERACRVFRIALPKTKNIEYDGTGKKITIVPTVALSETSQVNKFELIATYTNAAGTTVGTKTWSDLTDATINSDNCIEIDDDVDVTSGETVAMRKFEVTMNGESFIKSFADDTTAPDDVTSVTATYNSDRKRLSTTWTGEPSDASYVEVDVLKLDSSTSTYSSVYMETVNAGIGSLSIKTSDFDKGTYKVNVKVVDASGNKSTGVDSSTFSIS